MKKLSKAILIFALTIVAMFSFAGCSTQPPEDPPLAPTEIRVEDVVFTKVSSYVMDFGGGGAGALHTVSVFRVVNEVGLKEIKHSDFKLTRAGSSVGELIIEVLARGEDVFDPVLDTVELNSDNSNSYTLNADPVYIRIKGMSGTLDGHYLLSFLTETIDEYDLTFSG